MNKEQAEELPNNGRCLVVTCLPCNTPFRWKEAPDGCVGCCMLDWLCYDTEQEANDAYKKQNPERFNSEGNYVCHS